MNPKHAENTAGPLDEVVDRYLAALDRGECPDRHEVLRRHPELADELREFFENHDSFGGTASDLGELGTAPPIPEDRIVGDYEVLEEIGRGGMGVVFRARHRGLGREVALKMLMGGRLASTRDRERFRVEAAVAARLEHPGIVPVYDVGEYEGRAFYAMRYLDGGSLAIRADSFRGRPEEAARVVATVARTIQRAHENGVLHRDLKPENILLDAAGEPHVSDFGLAKVLREGPGVTTTGAIIGTPSFMAPELTSAGRATTACDVWGLGAVLYALLVGRPPFEGTSPLETLERVRHGEPVPPRRADSRVPAALSAVCMRCLEKDPARRYASADALADDLDRFLRGEPVTAVAAGPVRRTVKWLRRRPAIAALLVVTAAAAAVTLATALAYHVRLRSALDVSRRNLYLSEMELAQAAYRRGDLPALAQLLARQVPAGGEEDLRSFDWHYLEGRRACVSELQSGVSAMAVSPDGGLIALGIPGRGVLVRDATTREPAHLLEGEHGDPEALAFSPDGSRLAVLVRASVHGWPEGCFVHDLGTGRPPLLVAGVVDGCRRLFFSADGERLFLLLADESLRDVPSGSAGAPRVVVSSAERVSCATRMGDHLVTGHPDGALVVRDASSGAALRRWPAHETAVRDVAVRGPRVASGAEDGVVQVRDESGAILCQVAGGGASVERVALSIDGLFVASMRRFSARPAGEIPVDELSVHEIGNGRPQVRWPLPGLGCDGLRFAGAGRNVVDLRRSGTVRLLDAAALADHVLWESGAWMRALAVVGNRVLHTSGDAGLVSYDLDTEGNVAFFPGLAPHSAVRDVAASADGRFVASTVRTSAMLVWSTSDEEPIVRSRPLPGTARTVAIDGSGRRFAVGAFRNVLVVNARGEELVELEAHSDRVYGLAFSPDDRLLASCGSGDPVRLWRTDDWTLDRELGPGGSTAPGPEFRAVAFSRDGRLLAAGGERGLTVWRLASGAVFSVGAPKGLPAVHAVDFAPDGLALAAACDDGRIRLVDTATGRLRLVLDGHQGSVLGVAFNADGSRLVSCGKDGYVRDWIALPRARDAAGSAGEHDGGAAASRAPLVAAEPTFENEPRWRPTPLVEGAREPGWRGGAWGDADGDGDPDLLVTNPGEDRLFINDAGTLREAPAAGEIRPGESSETGGVAWGDADGDGSLDLAVVRADALVLARLSAGPKLVQTCAALRADGGGSFRAPSWIDLDGDGRLDLVVARARDVPAVFTAHDDGGRTEYRLATSGIAHAGAYAAAWADHDDDGDLDVYMTHNGNPNGLYRNDGDGRFTAITPPELLRVGSERNRSAAWGDLDGDGRLDLVVGCSGSEQSIFWKRADGRFDETRIRPALGLVFGVRLADYDNDGDLDVLFVDEMSHMVLLRNEGGRRLVDATSGELRRVESVHSAAWGDVDGDGDLDLFIAIWAEGPSVLINEFAPGNHWLHLDLEGTRSNRLAIGARVTLTAGGRRQIREVTGGGDALSQDSLTVEFGLGGAAEAELVEIRWPSGAVSRFESVAADRRVRVREGEGILALD